MKNYLSIFITALLCFAVSCSSGPDITAQERGIVPFRLNWSDYIICDDHDCPWNRYSPDIDLYGDVESVIIRPKDPSLDIHYMHDSDSKLIFEFNDHGDVSSMTLVAPTWSSEPIVTSYTYTYNSFGKATKCVTTHDSMSHTYETTYIYGPQGNLIGEKDPCGVFYAGTLEVYEYNSNGVLVKSRRNLCDDVDSYIVSYYGDNGLKTYSLHYCPEDIPYKSYYYYNDKGQLTSEVWYDPFQTSKIEYVIDFVVNYEYDDKGYMIKAITHYYTDSNAHHNDSHTPSERVVINNYKYDSKGNLIDDGYYTYEIKYR